MGYYHCNYLKSRNLLGIINLEVFIMNSKSVNRRLALAFAMVLLPSLSMLANANEKFPERPITIVVPAAPGGGSDASARIIAKYLTEKLGQSVAVLNRPGAAGIVAMNYVKGVAADGYVAHYSTGFILANHLIGLSKESWEEMLRPVAITGDLTNSVIVARKEVPINTFKELKERKDLSLVFAVEAGTVAEGLAVAINNETGGRMNIVPFGSASARMMGVLGGHADLAMVTVSIANDHLQSGKLKLIAGVADKRPSQKPEVSTLKEQGINIAMNSSHWIGLPKNTPDAVVAKFSTALAQVMKDPRLAKDYEILGETPVFRNGNEAYTELKATEKTTYEINKLIKK
jgi:tripartite-type tricarboxylate transporter receptor subunit TctC